MVSRQEHMAWCKQRALEILNSGDISGAFASMASDLTKHPETEEHPGTALGMGLMMIGDLKTTASMRKFIEGFN